MKRPFERIAGEVGRLVTEKNAAYGDSAATSGAALELLFPSGVAPAQYRDALLLVRIWDKMKRIATRKDAFGESPYRDIAGYGLIGSAVDEAGAVDELAAGEARERAALAEATCRFAGMSPERARWVLDRDVSGSRPSSFARALTAAEREALEAIARRSP
jgi:hypothetical protein